MKKILWFELSIFIGYFFLLQCTYRNCNYLLFRIGLQTIIFYSLFKMISKYSRKDTQTNQKKNPSIISIKLCAETLSFKNTFKGKHSQKYSESNSCSCHFYEKHLHTYTYVLVHMYISKIET